MISQVVGIVSALGIVAAFAALQFGLVDRHDLRYLLANLVCAGALTTVAVLSAQYGFVISNAFWTLVAAAGIVRVARRRGERSSPQGWRVAARSRGGSQLSAPTSDSARSPASFSSACASAAS